MHWVADQDAEPKNLARGETAKWKLIIKGRDYDRAFAFVERGDAMPLISLAAQYRARGPFCEAPCLFGSLKEAQMWCEQEVRLMEIGGLA